MSLILFLNIQTHLKQRETFPVTQGEFYQMLVVDMLCCLYFLEDIISELLSQKSYILSLKPECIWGGKLATESRRQLLLH